MFFDVSVPVEKLTLNEIGIWMVEKCDHASHADSCAYVAECRVSNDFMIRADAKRYWLLKAHPANRPIDAGADAAINLALAELVQKLQEIIQRLEAQATRSRLGNRANDLIARNNYKMGARYDAAAHVVDNWRKDEMP